MGCSEATARRWLNDGKLTAVAGRSPTQVIAQQVEEIRSEKLQGMGVLEQQAPDREQTSRQADAGDEEISRLREELALVKGALSDLTAAHSNLLDSFRRLSSDVPDA